MKSMKSYCILFASLGMLGCSTLKTVNPEDNKVAISSRKYTSTCEEIPRVYSGLAYNFCLANSTPKNAYNIVDKFIEFNVVVVDSACSAVADTLVLPYTTVRQIADGNLSVN